MINLNRSILDLKNYKGEFNQSITQSNVENRYNRLLKIPIKKIEDADLRFLITQEVCIDILIPIVLKRLHKDVLLEVEYYPGDLLNSVLSIDKEKVINSLYDEVLIFLESHNKQLKNATSDIISAINKFKSGTNSFDEEEFLEEL